MRIIPAPCFGPRYGACLRFRAGRVELPYEGVFYTRHWT